MQTLSEQSPAAAVTHVPLSATAAGEKPAPPPQRPSVGRIVHYVLPAESPRAGEHRAAIVTGAWGADIANLTVFLDQHNDAPASAGNGGWSPAGPYHLRAWSASQDETGKAPGTWHWPERV